MSIDAQRRQLVELAQARGLPIVAEFADAVESGKDDDRPGFQSMLRALRNPRRGWDTILVLDTARVARRRHLSIIFEEHECKRAGVKVIYKSLPESDPITEMLLKSILHPQRQALGQPQAGSVEQRADHPVHAGQVRQQTGHLVTPVASV